MATIDRMQILGIRSFGPKPPQTIHFQAPLTLIVGYNGSGKTTIIECLKYATTGELPPNSKTGGAFIHDPNLVGEKDMMAQVKLSFRSTSGVRMIATRSMQLTLKKTTRTQKTLDGSLQMKRDGVTETISSRVAELDQILPQYLGVSKAILENVIFCHQDDSLWPMSEPSNLKKKFDSIFEAEKYTKAIDNIKIIRKEQAAALGVYQANEKHAKENKLRGEKSEQKTAALYDEMEGYREQYDKVVELCDEAQQKSTEAFGNAAKFEQVIAQLNGKRVAFETNTENVASLVDNLKVMEETDGELESMLEKYQERVKRYAEQQEEFKGQYGALQQNLQIHRNSLGAKQSEIGKHEAEKEQHERNLQKRESLIQETAKRHNIRGFEYDMSDDQILEFDKILETLSRDQNRSLERVRKEVQDELKDAQAKMNQLSEQKSILNQRKDSAKSQITANDKRISDLQAVMNKIRADEGAEANLQNRKTETEQQLEKANADAASGQYNERIQEFENTVKTIDERTQRLQSELAEAAQLAKETASLDFAQEKLTGTQHSLETMNNVHSARISQLVDPQWDASTLEVTFQRAISESVAKVKEAEARRDIAQSKLENIKFRLSTIDFEQKKKYTELQNYEKIVLEAIQKDDIAEFEETLSELEEQYELTSSDQAKIEAQLEYMQSCLKVAREHNQCRLCKRSLKNDPTENFTKAGFLSGLENLVEKALKNAGAENVDELFAELETARNARPSYNLAIRARDTELPALQAEHEKLISERDIINKQLEDHDSIIYDLQKSLQEIESLNADARSIVNYYNQVLELENQIHDLKKSQKGRLSRGAEAVQADLQKISEENRSTKLALASIIDERDKSQKLRNMLEIQIRDINAELNVAQASLKEKRSLAERIEEYRLRSSEQRDAIRGFDQEMQSLSPLVEQAEVSYDNVNRLGNDRVHAEQEKASKLSDSVRQLNNAKDDIATYINKGGSHRLAQTQQEMESLQGEIQQIEQEMTQVARDVKKIEESLSSTEHTKQSIFDNIRYRRAKRALETLDLEIKSLESQNAEKDQDYWSGQGQHWNFEHQRLNAEKIHLSSTLKQKDIQLEDLIEEYKQEYQDAASKYREMHIKVETTKAACEDLARYGNALDQAIMKYHSIKMQEINQIIDELWRNAYQGTDVDTVRIRSDHETGRANRTYNYRVVMIKNGTEMDMRGRCSAGQKVLACIVIRLALAECFGTNCGLIALDEPTTNLDTQNIKGLADSLSQIIQMRRRQTNFQLLVITHDEQFLREMNCSDYTEVYWRVDRDANQRSFIERQNINEVS